MYELGESSNRSWHVTPPYLSSSNENSRNFETYVKLQNVRDQEDVRYITLKPDKPCFIGRASKTKGEGHLSSVTNALFECPVVSRNHAELAAHPWSSTGDWVTITDNGSMHGTRVNGQKLERGRRMALKDDDVIEFGDRVTRGYDTHDSIRVSYHRVITKDSNALDVDATAESVGYRGQSYSDDEYDDEYDGSVGDDISNASDVDDDCDELQPFSSKTTPERPKLPVGSQGNPIHVEPLQAAAIDLTGDKQASNVASAPPDTSYGSQPCVIDSNRVVQDSVINNVEVSRIESDGSEVPDDFNAIEDLSDDDNEAGLDPAAELDDEEGRLDDEDIVLSARDQEDLDDDNDFDKEEDIRVPSPELGSDTGFIDLTDSIMGKRDTIAAVPSPEGQKPLHLLESQSRPLPPPFDPVRSPKVLSGPQSSGPNTAPVPHGPSFNLSGSSVLSSACEQPGLFPKPYAKPNQTRQGYTCLPWDAPGGSLSMPPPLPPSTSYPTVLTPSQLQHSYGVPGFAYPPPPPPPRSLGASCNYPSFTPAPMPASGPQFPVYSNGISTGLASYGPPRFEPAPPRHHSPEPKTTFHARQTDRISIGELTHDEAGALRTTAVSPVVTCVKRKADEISGSESAGDANVVDDADPNLHEPRVVDGYLVNATATSLQTPQLQEPLPRRRRVSEEDDVSTAIKTASSTSSTLVSIAKTTAKYTGLAVLGSAGTLAFLASPLAKTTLDSIF